MFQGGLEYYAEPQRSLSTYVISHNNRNGFKQAFDLNQVF